MLHKGKNLHFVHLFTAFFYIGLFGGKKLHFRQNDYADYMPILFWSFLLFFSPSVLSNFHLNEKFCIDFVFQTGFQLVRLIFLLGVVLCANCKSNHIQWAQTTNFTITQHLNWTYGTDIRGKFYSNWTECGYFFPPTLLTIRTTVF